METPTSLTNQQTVPAIAIEHTNLRVDATKEDIEKLCNEAAQNNFYGVCVPPYYVQLAKKILKKTGVKVVTVVGFPLGYSTTSSKVEETKKAIISGADEVDMVININALKSGDWATVQNDIQAVVTACHLQNKLCKVIVETAYLTNEELEKVCVICKDTGADFVKTSTGFAQAGASIEHVKFIRKIIGNKMKIKASGGIKDHTFALQLLAAGADRLGTSSGLNLVSDNSNDSL